MARSVSRVRCGRTEAPEGPPFFSANAARANASSASAMACPEVRSPPGICRVSSSARRSAVPAPGSRQPLIRVPMSVSSRCRYRARCWAWYRVSTAGASISAAFCSSSRLNRAGSTCPARSVSSACPSSEVSTALTCSEAEARTPARASRCASERTPAATAAPNAGAASTAPAWRSCRLASGSPTRSRPAMPSAADLSPTPFGVSLESAAIHAARAAAVAPDTAWNSDSTCWRCARVSASACPARAPTPPRVDRTPSKSARSSSYTRNTSLGSRRTLVPDPKPAARRPGRRTIGCSCRPVVHRTHPGDDSTAAGGAEDRPGSARTRTPTRTARSGLVPDYG
ncbi:hypothetical protein SAMN05421867_108158 [Cellulomonas marina]|uniref:Uncharacterized protein n=1 Tax=Cellulomonas marina TaxID=988821 RepID=A0A1I0YTG2_9CELL|nr:hypothetical protein SAMN05421867_108158 [Cellulomonas marina]